MKKFIRFTTVLPVLISLLCVPFVVSADFPRMKVGDTMNELPTATVGSVVQLTDKSKLADGEFSISWDEIKGADSYSVRILFNINYMEKNQGILNFIYDKEIKSTETNAVVTGLQYGRRYTVLVYGVDSEGKDMAVCDRLHVFTFPENEWIDFNKNNLTDQNDEGFKLTTELIIIIIAVVTAVLLVVMIIVIKKILK